MRYFRQVEAPGWMLKFTRKSTKPLILYAVALTTYMLTYASHNEHLHDPLTSLSERH